MPTLEEMAAKAQAAGIQLISPIPIGSLISAHPRENHLTATVLTTATQVSIYQPNRILFTAVNLSANIGHLGVSNQVSTTNGILVAAAGGSVTFRFLEDLELTTLAFWALNEVAQGTWWFLELLYNVQM